MTIQRGGTPLWRIATANGKPIKEVKRGTRTIWPPTHNATKLVSASGDPYVITPPGWARYVDYIILSGGGGGSGGPVGLDAGRGGSPGVYKTGTLDIWNTFSSFDWGSHFNNYEEHFGEGTTPPPWSNLRLLVYVGRGGSGGSGRQAGKNGESTYIGIVEHGVTGFWFVSDTVGGGLGGVGSVSGGGRNGDGPGNQSFAGMTIEGGSGNSAAPGSGGRGGGGALVGTPGSGADGARGEVYYKFRT